MEPLSTVKLLPDFVPFHGCCIFACYKHYMDNRHHYILEGHSVLVQNIDTEKPQLEKGSLKIFPTNVVFFSYLLLKFHQDMLLLWVFFH